MKAIVLTIAAILGSTLLSGCTTVDLVWKDPRCQYRQHCIYTDPPPAIRTEPIRSSNVYSGDPAAR